MLSKCKVDDIVVADVEGRPVALYIVGQSKGSWHLGPEKGRPDNISYKVRKSDGLETTPRSLAPIRFMPQELYTEQAWLQSLRSAIYAKSATLPFDSRLSEMTIAGLAKDLGVFTPKPTTVVYHVSGAPLPLKDPDDDYDES